MKGFKKVFWVLALIPSVFSASDSIGSSTVSYSMYFSSSDLSFNTEEGFDVVLMKGCEVMADTSRPALPIKYINMIVPTATNVDSVLVTYTSTESVPGSYNIIPAQLPRPTDLSPPPPFVEPDSQTYASSSPYPGKLVEATGIGYFDGANRIVTLAIFPLEYVPPDNQLTLYTQIDFTMYLNPSGQEGAVPQARALHMQQLYDDYLEALVENDADIASYCQKPDQLVEVTSPASAAAFDYVVITADSLVSYFEEFVGWLNKKGIRAIVVSVESIYDNYTGDQISGIYDDAGKVKEYLYDAYYYRQACFALLGGFGAGLFGGNENVPVRVACPWLYAPPFHPDSDQVFCKWVPTDLYYSSIDPECNWNVDGDSRYGVIRHDRVNILPEIFVGRIPFHNGREILNWTEKLLTYEQNPGNGDYSYLIKAYWAQADELQALKEAQETQTHFPDNIYHAPITEEQRSYDAPLPTSPRGAQVISEINQEYGFVNWFHHGDHQPIVSVASNSVNTTPRWVVTPLDEYAYHMPEESNGLDNLTNLNKYFLLSSIGCHHANYDVAYCYWVPGVYSIAGGSVLFEKKGAVAFLGNTRHGYFTGSMRQKCRIFDQLFQGESSRIGICEALGKGPLVDAKGYSHNLIGDPQMEVWTDTPKHVAMFCSTTTMECGPNDIYVTVKDEDSVEVESALVCLLQDDWAYGIEYTDSCGRAVFSGSFKPWTISLVASKKNHIPAEVGVEIDCPDTPTDVQATPISPSRIRITWTDNSENETAFEICRQDTTSGPYFRDLATVNSPGVAYIDNSVECDSYYYCYKVRAIVGDVCGSSRSDPPACATTDTCLTPECPFLYVWNGDGFVNDNVILTGSEDEFSNKPSLSDYYVLSQDLRPTDDKYELEIREFENETSRIDHVRLFAVDYPLGRNIGVTPEGKVWIYSDPISPISCTDQDGVDHLDEILSKDEKYFTSNRPGHLVVNFGKLRNSAFFKPSDQMAHGGGGGTQPPPKEPPPGMRVASWVPSNGNIAYIDIIGDSGEWENVAKLYPRTRPVLTLVELSQYVKPDEDFKIKIRWEQAYSADHIAYYRFDDTQLAIRELPLSSASHSLEGDINAVMTGDDDQRALLSPEQSIKLSFAALPDDSSKQRSFLFVVKGYYEKFATPPAGTQELARIDIPKMDQNYPNPFNVSTGINFTLPEAANVTLNIYNILGQKVATLVDGERPAGEQSVFWDGKDKGGAEVASGIYFYQIKAGDFKQLKKMLLIK